MIFGDNLVLHVQFPNISCYRERESKPFLVFPMLYIRNYGQEQGKFVLEAGRRCPGGEGIYGFELLETTDRIVSLIMSDLANRPGGGVGGVGGGGGGGGGGSDGSVMPPPVTAAPAAPASTQQHQHQHARRSSQRPKAPIPSSGPASAAASAVIAANSNSNSTLASSSNMAHGSAPGSRHGSHGGAVPRGPPSRHSSVDAVLQRQHQMQQQQQHRPPSRHRSVDTTLGPNSRSRSRSAPYDSPMGRKASYDSPSDFGATPPGGDEADGLVYADIGDALTARVSGLAEAAKAAAAAVSPSTVTTTSSSTAAATARGSPPQGGDSEIVYASVDAERTQAVAWSAIHSGGASGSSAGAGAKETTDGTATPPRVVGSPPSDTVADDTSSVTRPQHKRYFSKRKDVAAATPAPGTRQVGRHSASALVQETGKEAQMGGVCYAQSESIAPPSKPEYANVSEIRSAKKEEMNALQSLYQQVSLLAGKQVQAQAETMRQKEAAAMGAALDNVDSMLKEINSLSLGATTTTTTTGAAAAAQGGSVQQQQRPQYHVPSSTHSRAAAQAPGGRRVAGRHAVVKQAAAAPNHGVTYCLALWDNKSDLESELSFRKGDRLQVMARSYLSSNDWWLCRRADGRVGCIPRNYVELEVQR